MLRIIILSIFYFSLAYTQDSITIVNDGQNFDDFEVSIYEDKSNLLKFEEIQKIKDFKPYSNRVALGYNKSSFWFKFKLKNNTQQRLQYYLQFTENFTEKLDIYIKQNNQYKKYKKRYLFIHTTNQ
jgi:hypothetical protein